MTDKASDRLRITNQFRSKTGFAYDLKQHEAKVTLNIAPSEGSPDAEAWRVDARVKLSSAIVTVSGSGATRADAIRAVGRSWISQPSAPQLPVFDWEAVILVLSAVRAV